MFERLLALRPDDVRTRRDIAETYLRSGDLDRAWQEMNKLPDSGWLNSLKAEVLFAMGKEDESRVLTRDFLNTPVELGTYAKAMIHAVRGENDSAFEFLDVAFEQRDSRLANILLAVPLHPLEADPRYPVFLEKLGLLEAWQAMPPD